LNSNKGCDVQIDPFKLERYFLDNESKGTLSLSSAICDPLKLKDLLAYAGLDSLETLYELSLGYTDSYGNPDLRKAIAALYGKLIQSDNLIEVLPTEGILVALNCLLEPGDHVISCYPVYEPLYRVARAIPCEVSWWKANPDQWQFDVDELETLIQPGHTKLIIINFPHNPTGAILTHDQLNRVIGLARKHNCRVFSDEIFRWSEQEETDRLPAVCDVYEKGVTLSGMSKTFSLPGVRVGWLATQEKPLVERFSIFKDYTTGCASASSEVFALIALTAKDRIIQRTLQIVGRNLLEFESFFDRHRDKFRWVRPKSSLVTLVELLDEDDPAGFARALLSEQNILIAPGSVLMLDELPNGCNYFRLGFGLGLSDLHQALCGFEDFLEHRVYAGRQNDR
jgi:aspartate/methionine/tyrosine aminotransferase